MRQRLRTLFRITGFVLVIAGLFCTVILNMRYHQLVSQVQDLRIKTQEVVRANEQLQIIIARGQNFGRLQEVAEKRLKMYPPNKVEFIFVE